MTDAIDDSDGVESLGRMLRMAAPGVAAQADKAKADDDALTVGDMLADEFAALLTESIEREIERLQAEIAAKLDAPTTTTKAKKTTKAKIATFKG